jgi:hypothetical protein
MDGSPGRGRARDHARWGATILRPGPVPPRSFCQAKGPRREIWPVTVRSATSATCALAIDLACEVVEHLAARQDVGNARVERSPLWVDRALDDVRSRALLACLVLDHPASKSAGVRRVDGLAITQLGRYRLARRAVERTLHAQGHHPSRRRQRRRAGRGSPRSPCPTHGGIKVNSTPSSQAEEYTRRAAAAQAASAPAGS